MDIESFWTHVTNAAGCNPPPPETIAELVDFAVQQHRAKTADGDAMAAACLYYGWGQTEPKYVSAFTHAMSASADGHPWGHFYYAVCLYKAQGVEEKDYYEAQTFMRYAVEGDVPLALCDLGLITLWGHGLPAHPGDALSLFQQAADKEVPMGLYLLGHCYATGKWVAPNFAKARELWEKAAAKGHIKAAEEMKYLPVM